ncbi:hypothetical protein HOI83_04125 [Candidatus Uhrbacteria bacterium]|jgi:hypothetical protein|nr:hypothetical protein [Candidatus Uhrbacteria bacterium]
MSNETDDPIETTDPDALPVNPDEVDEDAATILDEANAGNGGGNTEEIDDDEIDDEEIDDDEIDDDEIDDDADALANPGGGNPDDDGGGNPDDTDTDDDEPKKSWILPVGLIVLTLLVGFWAISMLIPSNPGPVIAAADDDDSAEDDSFYVDVDPDHCVIVDTSPHARRDRLAQCLRPRGAHTYCWWRNESGTPIPLTCERVDTPTFDPTAGS